MPLFNQFEAITVQETDSNDMSVQPLRHSTDLLISNLEMKSQTIHHRLNAHSNSAIVLQVRKSDAKGHVFDKVSYDPGDEPQEFYLQHQSPHQSMEAPAQKKSARVTSQKKK